MKIDDQEPTSVGFLMFGEKYGKSIAETSLSSLLECRLVT